MKKNLILIEYLNKIEASMQGISNSLHGSGDVQSELVSSLDALQEKTSGKITLLFIEISLEFFSRLLPILLSKNNLSKSEQIDEERKAKIDHYIQTNLENEINVNSAANYVGMSSGHFSRFFKKMFHCSFKKYLMHCKVDLASKILLDSDLKIIDVCYRSGFSAHNKFNRVFKKVKKKTPTEYRESLKKSG